MAPAEPDHPLEPGADEMRRMVDQAKDRIVAHVASLRAAVEEALAGSAGARPLY